MTRRQTALFSASEELKDDPRKVKDKNEPKEQQGRRDEGGGRRQVRRRAPVAGDVLQPKACVVQK